MKTVHEIIRSLGATKKYKGYKYLEEAVEMVAKMQDQPLKVTKDVYPFLASKYKSSPMNVEHDIRTVINVCWNYNKEGMDEIAGYTMTYRPTNSEFIDMLAYYMVHEKTRQASSNAI